MTDKLYITDKEAAVRYSKSRQWFSIARQNENGPKYIKIKRSVLYPVKETDEWFSDHALRKSTKEHLENKIDEWGLPI